MITTIQLNAIKKYLSKKYSPTIIAHLNKKKIFNTRGNPYSPDSIQKIVNGDIENIPVEKEIFKLIKKAKEAKKTDLENRKEILKK